MSKIKAVIFDADGVVNDGKLLSLEKFGIPSERLQSFFREAFPNCLINKSDLKEAIVPYLSEWQWTGSVDELLNYWFESGNEINEVVWNMAESLKEQGVRIYVGTNQEKYRTQFMCEHMGYDALFDEVYSSADLGVVKPMDEFFLRMKQGIGVDDASAILFWDDMEKNVEAAKRLGFTAHVFKDNEDFLRRMNEYFAFNA